SAPIDAAETWQSFYHTFHTLADEELQLEPHNVNDRWLRAYASYEDQSSECGLWSLSDGVNEGFKARFEVAATRARIALNLPLLNRPLHVWLHHVFRHLLDRKSKLLFSETEEGGIIVRVCEASAIYCAVLERGALESRKIESLRSPTISRKPTMKSGRAFARPT